MKNIKFSQKGFTLIRTRLRLNLADLLSVRTRLRLNLVSAQGFTLIEVLMVILIMGVVIVSGGSLYFTILKGASKTEMTREVKQNGAYALGMMERIIRSAKTITCSPDPGPNYKSITVINPDSTSTVFACIEENDVAKISMGSDKLTGNNVTLNSTGLCNNGSAPFSLNFNCSSASNPQKVTISFTLYQKGTAARPEEQAQSTFQTTISSRTY